ncbi:MAG: hypothetical protein Q7K98_04320 [Candidatus Omnitrophota bacterium]|nr:hypothetical protein [Candidatus Omnitrophota bacterium]
MEIFIFSILNIGPLLCSYMLTRKYFSFRGYVDTLLAFLILFYTQIIATITLLGVLHILYLRNILLFNSVMFFLVWLISRPAQGCKVKNDLSGFVAWLRAFSLTDKIIIFCFSFICAFALVKVAVNLINPPFGWDDLNYHFTFAVEWLKSGTLVTPIVVSDYPAPSYYPLNGSFIFFWLLLPFKNVFLADLGQVPFYIVTFLCMYSIGKKVGLSRRYSFYAAILLLLTPNYFKQMKIAYVDVMVTAFFLLALNFLFNLRKDFSIKNILLIGLSTGLLIGTKIIVIPHALIIALYFLWISYLLFVRNKLYSRFLLSVVLFVLAIVAMGGFSYARNFLMTGNPLYPLQVKIFGITLFRGVLGGEFINNENNGFSLGKFLFHEGVGVGFILYAIPGLILAGLGLIKKRSEHKPYLWFLFILIPFLYFIYRFEVGVPNIRYLYPWFAVCYILVIWGMSIFTVPEKWIRYGLIVCVLASTGEFARRQELIFSFLLSVVLFAIFLNTNRIKRFLLGRPYITFFIIFIVGGSFLQYLYIDYSKNELKRYNLSQKNSGFWPEAIDAWIWLDQNTSGNNIAYVGRPVPFPLYGTNLKNNVFYISVNEGEPYLHNYKNACYSCKGGYENFHNVLMETNNYRGKADYNTWLRNLKVKNTNFLFVYSLHQIKGIDFPIEDGWAKAHQEIFSQVFTNNTIHVYKIR